MTHLPANPQATMDTSKRSAKALTVDVALCAVWCMFAYWVLEGWHSTGQPVGLGLFLVNTTFAYLFVARRPVRERSELPRDWSLTVLTILLSFSLGMGLGERSHEVVLQVSCVVQCLAAGLLFASVCSLGRSFGLVPANRGVKVKGMYAYVRHPLYACEMLFYSAFVLGHPSTRNLVVLAGIVLGLYMRARAEERLLARDAQYREYLGTVPYRFVPGVI